MKKSYFLIGIVLSIFFVSCASVNDLYINVERPAKISFPNSVSRIVVLNNSAEQPDDINHIQREYAQERGTFSISANGLGDVLVGQLSDELVSSRQFSGVFLSERINSHDRTFLEAYTLSRLEADSILKIYDGDLLFTLDRYVARLSTDVENIGDGLTHSFYVVDVFANFSFYDKDGVRRRASIPYQDTLYWSQYTQGQYLLSDPLPTPEEALDGAIAYVGEQVAKMLYPNWEETHRIIYSDITTDMKRANVYWNSDEWSEARSIWLSLFNEESKPQKKARLASNIALSFEIEDNLDKALEWVEQGETLLVTIKDYSTNEDYMRLMSYKSELERRILDFEILDLQYSISE